MTTNEELKHAVNVLNNRFARHNQHNEELLFHIGRAYGKPRLHRATKGGGEVDISPRLPPKELLTWIHAFMEGIDFLEYNKPCTHENKGTHWENNTKIVSCRDCDKVLYRGQGGPSDDNPAKGC